MDAAPPPRVEFCITNEAESAIQGAWRDLAPHRAPGVLVRRVEEGQSACGWIEVTRGPVPLRLQREGAATAAACEIPAQPWGRRYVFSYHANAEIGERCELVAVLDVDDGRP